MRRPALPIAATLAVLVVVALSGCSAGSRGDVRLSDTGFAPDDAQLAIGAALRFTMDAEAKQVHMLAIHKSGEPADDLLLERPMAPSDSVAYTFEDGGTYHIWCTTHGSMTAGLHMIVKVD